MPGFPHGALGLCDGCGASRPEGIDVLAWERVAAVMALELGPGGVRLSRPAPG